MAPPGHPYRNGVRGRSLTSSPGVGSTSYKAHVVCSRCPTKHTRPLRALMPPDQIDKKFVQLGWTLDPNVCPTCRAKSKEMKAVASKPTQAAMKAQAQMFTLLSTHFDPDAGAYAAGWSDQRVATESGLAADHVAEFRKAGFGEFKEPSDIAALRQDIVSLDAMVKESAAELNKEITSLRSRLADISKRYAA